MLRVYQVGNIPIPHVEYIDDAINLVAEMGSGVHGLASGQKPGQAKALVEYYLFTYFQSNWHISFFLKIL
jgi:hypothetical protein